MHYKRKSQGKGQMRIDRPQRERERDSGHIKWNYFSTCQGEVTFLHTKFCSFFSPPSETSNNIFSCKMIAVLNLVHTAYKIEFATFKTTCCKQRLQVTDLARNSRDT